MRLEQELVGSFSNSSFTTSIGAYSTSILPSKIYVVWSPISLQLSVDVYCCLRLHQLFCEISPVMVFLQFNFLFKLNLLGNPLFFIGPLTFISLLGENYRASWTP